MAQRKVRERKLVRVYVPSSQKRLDDAGNVVATPESDWLWLEVQTGSFTLGEIASNERLENEGQQAYGIRLMISRITDWNLFDDPEETRKVPLTPENIHEQLDADDIVAISDKIGIDKPTTLSPAENLV